MRLTFSRVPASAYRLAEPGDTLDRRMIYLSAAGVVLAAAGLVVNRGRAALAAALAVGLAALWYSGTPGPTVDGWHGLGWRTIFDPNAPRRVRAALAPRSCRALGHRRRDIARPTGTRSVRYWGRTRCDRTRWLWIAALVLPGRQVEIPGVEPPGYWPRWAMIWALFAFNLAIVIELAPGVRSKGRLAASDSARCRRVACAGGRGRLAFVVSPSAGPSQSRRTGSNLHQRNADLARTRAAQGRHRFRTIINLFPEDTPQGSPLLADELKFAREHGIHTSEAPPIVRGGFERVSGPDAGPGPGSGGLADPGALSRLHGSIPGLDGDLSIRRRRTTLAGNHAGDRAARGYRPKASVTLLYNRVLPLRAGARYWADPTAAILRRCAEGTADPMIASGAGGSGTMNLGAQRPCHHEPAVVRPAGASARIDLVECFARNLPRHSPACAAVVEPGPKINRA